MAATAPRQDVLGTIYLLHFSEPFGHARHYLGWTESDDVERRIARHRSGQGARLVRAVVNAGLDFKLVRTWANVTRRRERQLKVSGHSARWCPICKEERDGARKGKRGTAAPSII
jgi:predicted GIY-YIG superfamily endonuclease